MSQTATRRFVLSLLWTSVCLTGSLAVAADAPSQPTIKNFHQVNEFVYRGAQPKDAEFKQLAALGVKTVINLRSTDEHIEDEKKIVESLGMRYVSIPLHGYATPPDSHIRQALNEFQLAESSGKPVFVHCRLGKDRTGTVVACYRMAHDNWKNDAALKEARGYGMNPLQRAMRKYILAFNPNSEPAITSASN